MKPIDAIRADFPALQGGTAYFDGPGGTQAPRRVIDAVSRGLVEAMSNTHGAFAASERAHEVVEEARRAIADLVGGDPAGVILGPNMTTLTFRLADALARTWREGDEVIVTRLDHDGNVRPWVLAAGRAGAIVRWADIDPATCELDPAQYDDLLSERTRRVAVTAASNAVGTRPDVRAIADRAHAAGAITYVDGVHATPHGPIDVAALGADFYACSTYKLFGPHVGCVTARPELLEPLRPAKLAPASDASPDRFEIGTPTFELLAGVTGAVDYWASLAGEAGPRRERVLAAMAAAERHTQGIFVHILDGLAALPGVSLVGSPGRRTPTLAFNLEGHSPRAVAAALARDDICVWDGDYYAYELMRRLGLAETGGAVRVGVVAYNTREEAERLLAAVVALAGDRAAA